ncbi:MAG: hypothetical protein K2N61_11690 [Lachnospiraceae bacterium]|nr:hypothetical protein [Lachnospiraceae bacterium]
MKLVMADNMKADLYMFMVENAHKAFPSIRGAVIHSDRGNQYTSTLYRVELKRGGLYRA